MSTHYQVTNRYHVHTFHHPPLTSSRIVAAYVTTAIYLLNENILNEDNLSRWQTNLETYTILYKIFLLFQSVLKRNWPGRMMEQICISIQTTFAFTLSYTFYSQLPFKNGLMMEIYSFFVAANVTITIGS